MGNIVHTGQFCTLAQDSNCQSSCIHAQRDQGKTSPLKEVRRRLLVHRLQHWVLLLWELPSGRVLGQLPGSSALLWIDIEPAAGLAGWLAGGTQGVGVLSDSHAHRLGT